MTIVQTVIKMKVKFLFGKFPNFFDTPPIEMQRIGE